MKIAKALQNYEREAILWEDELGVSLVARMELFHSNLLQHADLSKMKLTADDISLARFLYYHFWFRTRALTFEKLIAAAESSFLEDHGGSFYAVGFGKLHRLNRKTVLWPREALDIADGLRSNFLFRPIALALIAEYTRSSRLLLAISKRSPILLGDFNLVLAALKLSADERSLHAHLVEACAEGEEVKDRVTCGMGECRTQATWLVVCPHNDGYEYLCQRHKSEDDLTFETFRIIFSGSCRHHVERRECTYYLVARAQDHDEIPVLLDFENPDY